MLNSMSTYCAH